ncbi:MAG: PilT/PilU family type 4a pilus ATPase [Candidatus Sumerlaeaceae bacterium]|nr:PilT/PilU family type 4a pilus ATPase [Candidatus Sumerlaeaceae bacterium]
MPVNINLLLEAMPRIEASDLHLKVGVAPLYRINGELRPVEHTPLTDKDILEAIDEIMAPRKKVILDEQGTVDFGYSIPNVSRFRINVFRQRGSLSMAIRTVKLKTPTFDDLRLPVDTMERICDTRRGLVLVTGVTGSGKSTTLAAMISYINRTRREHIITVEDPIEYAYRDDKSIINQIEVGTDIPTFEIALKYVLRQDPDVILIGEMRDVETVKTALTATETGHMCFGTLHTSDATQTINRILHFFSAEEEKLILEQLSLNLRAVVSQRLILAAGSLARIPALEIMIGTPIVRKLIREGRITELKQAIKNQEEGMITFNQHLVEMAKARIIDFEEGLKYCEDEGAYRRNVKGIYSEGDRGGLVGV